MSITVRLWNKEDLENLQSDKWLATVFMNGHTFSKEEIRHYPYNLRKTYEAWFNDSPEEAVIFFATDDKMAIKFLEAEYVRLPDSLNEVITTRRIREVKPIELS